MHFDDYQVCAEDTAKYPGQGEFTGLAYAALGLNGEAGEVAEKVKKLWRDGGTDVSNQVYDILHAVRLATEDATNTKDVLTAVEDAEIELGQVFTLNIDDEKRNAIIKELGDTLWYCSAVATELGIPLSDVAAFNLEKLRSRKERNVLSGSGDDR